MTTRNTAIAPGLDRFTVTGGGGARLHVVQTGNLDGRPLLFVHGFSQSWLAWRQQLASDLADDFRLVAMDLRGHGRSDKPDDAYADGALWAEDIAAVVRELRLEQPVLCGWSYGTIVALDYLRNCGEDAIGGLAIVAGLTKLGTETALAVLTPELLDLIPGLFGNARDESVRSLTGLLQLCFVEEPAPVDLYPLLGYNVAVPPGVRQALFSRIRKPVLVVHGAEDAIVRPPPRTSTRRGSRTRGST